MFDSGKIIPGLIIFVLIFTIPVWYNLGGSGKAPEPELPKDAKQCVLPAEEMRTGHMKLLNTWRDEVLRDGDRSTFEIDGKSYKKSLMLTCMKCHTSKKKFCDACHDYASVKPYCWDCHLAPEE
ncbi:MAG: cytochrome C [Desulfobulbus propionicus]|nr:MAG: cytochrome C [Desulfobulbus propionicus]